MDSRVLYPRWQLVKVVKAIFSAFQFVAENLENIRHFFDSIFDSMEAAMQGNTEGVASKVITGLTTGVVLALDFLAKQLGIDTIVNKVHNIIQAIRTPIVKAIEWVLRKAVQLVQATGKFLFGKKREKKEGKQEDSLEMLDHKKKDEKTKFDDPEKQARWIKGVAYS